MPHSIIFLDLIASPTRFVSGDKSVLSIRVVTHHYQTSLEVWPRRQEISALRITCGRQRRCGYRLKGCISGKRLNRVLVSVVPDNVVSDLILLVFGPVPGRNNTSFKAVAFVERTVGSYEKMTLEGGNERTV